MTQAIFVNRFLCSGHKFRLTNLAQVGTASDNSLFYDNTLLNLREQDLVNSSAISGTNKRLKNTETTSYEYAFEQSRER